MTAHVWSNEAKRQAFCLKDSLYSEIECLEAFCLSDEAMFEAVKPMIGAMLDAALAVDGEAISRNDNSIAKFATIRAILGDWQRADHIRLRAGEMTAAEMRSMKAVVAAIERDIEKVIGDDD